MDNSTGGYDPTTMYSPPSPSRTFRRSETVGALAAALAKTQGALQPARQTKTQSAFRGVTYAGLDDSWSSARGPLSANGLSIIQMPVDSDRDGWVSLTTLLLHTSDEWIEATFSMPVEKPTPHGYGSCLTYLRRYALNAYVGLVSSADDDDGNAASGVAQPVPSQKRALVEPDGFAQFERLLKDLSLKRPFTKTHKAALLKAYSTASVACRGYLAQERPTVDAKIREQAKEAATES